MAINLPPELLERLQAEAEKQQTTPAELLRRWLDQEGQQPEESAGNALLETSKSLDNMEPAIPTEDLSEHFDAYLRTSWGDETQPQQQADDNGA